MREFAVVAVLCASMPAAAVAGSAIGSPVLKIGPKQDDSLRDCAEEIGPKQDDPRQAIIVQGGRTGRPGDDDDPHARGENGARAIGPKQDDPRRPGELAIGPKQDDPRQGIIVQGGRHARPGDDKDPHARQKVRACRVKAKAKE